ncbi:hypothetical protein Taro_005653 [Colocasia esculenta]|uniref:DYW domain-containing protein n=1 Tax=Colocasia esculenta TaxID=4460 RepID=A0A843TTP4_COLES|nr:hypothetical protein [Colocasia esculenta]
MMAIGGSVLPQSSHHHLLTPNNSHGQVGPELWQRQLGCPSSLLPHQCRSLEEFRQVHAQLIKLGQDGDTRRAAGDLIAACALSDWGSMDYALSIFRCVQDPTSFQLNALIRGFVRRGDPAAAFVLYRDVQEGGLAPDNFTFTFLLKACARFPDVGEGSQIHGLVCKHGFQSDMFVQNSLISMYGNCGEIGLSRKVFDQMGGQRSVASWSALLAAHTRVGLWKECLALYGRMRSEGWRADESTLVSVLSCSTHMGAMEIGRCLHCCLLRTTSKPNVIVQTSLVDMYIKCGCLKKGLRVFRAMEEKNLWTYSVVISGLAMHGDCEKALWVFADMLRDDLRPDGAVYVSVLTACSRAGLLAEGLRCFDRMRFEHHIMPSLQHYTCLVDLMARAGKLEEAYDFIRGMPVEPNSIIWRCLLSACRVHRNLELGELAIRRLLELDPGNAGDYLLMSNMYAQAGRWEDAARIRTAMVDRALLQVPGSSTVEADGKLHRFVSRDHSHPQSSAVHEMLQQMEWQLRLEGYSPDTSEVLAAEVDDNERLRILRGHSQKLAVAFGLISIDGAYSPIRIVKNLRMCRDCHTYTKLISKIFEREIIVRDRSRFHHFREGICSCSDYW